MTVSEPASSYQSLRVCSNLHPSFCICVCLSSLQSTETVSASEGSNVPVSDSVCCSSCLWPMGRQSSRLTCLHVCLCFCPWSRCSSSHRGPLVLEMVPDLVPLIDPVTSSYPAQGDHCQSLWFIVRRFSSWLCLGHHCTSIPSLGCRSAFN